MLVLVKAQSSVGPTHRGPATAGHKLHAGHTCESGSKTRMAAGRLRHPGEGAALHGSVAAVSFPHGEPVTSPIWGLGAPRCADPHSPLTEAQGLDALLQSPAVRPTAQVFTQLLGLKRAFRPGWNSIVNYPL